VGTIVTLRDAFTGNGVGADGGILLGTDAYDFLYFPVRVSGAIVGTFGVPVNRSIEAFLDIRNSYLNGFVIRPGFNAVNSLNTTTATTSTRPQANLIVDIKNTGTKIVKNIAEIEALALNGNKNILAIKGNLTIENCENNIFKMSGIRTVLVE